ncbi:MAG: hypothetical protein AAGK78_04715, partial [Planctomycetota bacterium]
MRAHLNIIVLMTASCFAVALPANPLLAEPAKAPESAEASQASEDGWKTHQNAGWQIRLPADWTYQATELGIELLPQGADPNAERYVVSASPAAAGAKATDPTVTMYCDGVVASVAPIWQRTGTRAS